MKQSEVWKRAQALVAEMTLEEKASQLRYDAPAIPRLGIPSYNWWNEALHGVARAGTATVFPQAIGLAAMFDPKGLQDIADTIAMEGRAKYNMAQRQGDHDIYKGLTFWSPNINIFRDPRWGRGHETYGEDPFLTSRLGLAFVRGLQGNGKYLKAAACAKHFAVHSGPEDQRHSFDAQVSDKDLFETYLPAFETVVREGHVEAVMGAYNRVNGEPACGSPRLLTDILRGRWGFQGHVVSDCWAIADFHNFHHVTDTAPESAALAMTSGCDLNCGNTYLHLMQAYQDGLVSEEQITLSATRLMATRLRLGLFDPENPYNTIDPDQNDSPQNAQKALSAARRSMVLLKNDGLLPLRPERLRHVAVIGPNADSHAALYANYNGTSSRYVTFLEGVRRELADVARVYYSEGCPLSGDRSDTLAQAGDRLSEAKELALCSDVTILCLGLDATLEGEEGDQGNQYFSGDKKDLELPAPQRALIRAIEETGKPFVCVIAAGSALRVTEGNAILYAWYPGQAGGLALCDLLFGRVSPSGKLPITFYQDVSDLPPFEDYSMDNRTYRYYRGTPLYPFGFGLSYTRFAYSDARLEDGIVTVLLKNQGAVDAEEIVQVYIRAQDNDDATPFPKLCAMQRVQLAAGQERRVSLPLHPSAYTLINDQGERYTPHGLFTLYVGGSQPDERSFELLGQRPLEVILER